MNCSFNDLRNKEVINVCDGTRLGYVCDIDIDLCEGRICTLIIPGDSGLFGFSKCEPISIPWGKIERIGEDIILVSIPSIESEKGKKSFFE
ncbi:MAG: YlmC/YmxH family sporulation protein [Ruminococcaceae bacterium]|nr:YlmC/YmxH family sporulation protein [Oscillospiraceae bacterium]